jgi:hypothetical protein
MPARAPLALALAVVAAAALAGCGGGADLEGRWQGRLHQRGLAPFIVTATIRSLDPEAVNTVRYSGIDCSGTWRYLGRAGDAHRFREVIDRGRGGTCKGVGTVTLTPAGEHRLAYRFMGGGVESRGVLERTRPGGG